MISEHDIVIIGGGSAGLAAAIGAYQTGVRDILVVDRQPYLGGILPQCTHQGFGMRLLGKELTGVEYSQWLVDRFLRLNIPAQLSSSVTDIDKHRRLTLATPTGEQQIQANAIILATGCRERTIASLPDVSGTRPAGIFTAGSAQRMVNIAHWELGNRIVVLGSGDVGMIMARQFALQGKQVLAVLEQSNRLGGLRRNKQHCLDAHQIPLILDTTITELHGTGRLTGVTTVTQKTSSFISCDTLITSIGLIPELELLHNFEHGKPSWLFVAGNAHQIQAFVDNVVDDGNQAGTAAARYVKA